MFGKERPHALEPGGVRLDNRSMAVQAHDLRRTRERAEHQHDAAVLADVGDGLGAAARQVGIRGFARTQHTQ